MSILFFPINHPCAFAYVATAFSIYYASRAPFIQKYYHGGPQGWKGFRLWYVLYLQDIFYNFICSSAGFAAWYVNCKVFLSIGSLAIIQPGAVALIIFLSLLSVIGMSGQLPFLLNLGKFPGKA